MTSSILRRDRQPLVEMNDIDKKFWETIQYEQRLYLINSLKTVGDKNGDQGKLNYRSGHDFLYVD